MPSISDACSTPHSILHVRHIPHTLSSPLARALSRPCCASHHHSCSPAPWLQRRRRLPNWCWASFSSLCRHLQCCFGRPLSFLLRNQRPTYTIRTEFETRTHKKKNFEYAKCVLWFLKFRNILFVSKQKTVFLCCYR